MPWPAPASFRLQAAIIALASLAVVGLAAFLVSNVIATTEGTLRTEARQACVAACQELLLQYDERKTYGSNLQQMPPEAQDISLTAISRTVLRAFEGVEGGIYLVKEQRLSGYAYSSDPTGNRPKPRGRGLEFLRGLATRAAASADIITEENAFETNYIVWAASRTKSGEAVAITGRRMSLARDLLTETARRWLAVLVLFALLGMLGIVSIWYMLRSGVAGISRGLRKLQEDFTYRLPMIRGDFGEIAMAINGMAEHRATLEAELRRQDRLAALGKVVSGVAHEVRNPLNSMKLTLQLLDRRLKKGVPVSHEIQEALREIDRLDMIVSRLLAFGRPTMGNREVQNVAPLVEQAAKMVQEPARKKGTKIVVGGLEDGPAADVDGPQIVQVLINLFLNAIDASPQSKEVKVSAMRQEASVRIVVSDSGSGIPEEARQHIFDAYFTTKPNGSGLGLAVSREIIANHGGTLDFETTTSGTSFILQLPIDRSRPL
jgi:two-component system, NtrC family, sensor histidine kinase HydH